MSALAEWLTRWQPIAIHSAVLAGLVLAEQNDEWTESRRLPLGRTAQHGKQ
jgi:hypothetical protein